MKKLYRDSARIASVISSAFVLVVLFGSVPAFAASPAAVDLGTAGNFVILSKTGISATGSISIIGDIGVSPAAATYITGFGLILPAGGAFSTSALVTGKVYAPGYADPTSANLTTAVSDMQTAYADAAGRAADVTELGAGNIGGLTLSPGVYKWGTGLAIPTDVTLSGNGNDVWIFQVAQNLNLSPAAKIVLSGGAKAANIYWVVAGQTTIGTTAVFNGNILDQTAIVLNTGAMLNGRALAQTAVTLDANAVAMPSGGLAVPTSAVPATPAVSATPAIPAVSASGTNTSAIPATSATPAVPAAPSIQTLQNQVNALLLAIQSVKAQVQARQRSAFVQPSVFGQQVRVIAINLGNGSHDNNVAILQQFLISQNKGPASRALSEVGVTAYFGELTRAALSEFQAAAGISPALGNFGATTRAYLRANY
ncbi:MAG: ice-binding family protein [Candidatus Paceibacterota bacterium]